MAVTFVAPRHPAFSPKTAPLVISKQALSIFSTLHFPKNDQKKQQTKPKHMQNIIRQKMNRSCFLARGPKLALAVVAGCLTFGPLSRADMVTDWNLNFEKAAKLAAQLPPMEVRCAAIAQTAVFDAVNGIDREYEPYFVTERAPGGARAEAAVATAAYRALVALYPDQKKTCDAELAASLATIPGSNGKRQSIA
jgi:hypothetical protein